MNLYKEVWIMSEIVQRKKQQESILQLAKPKPLLSVNHKPKKNLLAAEKRIVMLTTPLGMKDIDGNGKSQKVRRLTK